jgi:hypothetical protein
MAIVIALLFASQAQADTVSFTGWANGYDVARFQLQGSNANSLDENVLVGAGGFNTLFGGSSFTSYCVDLYQEISLPSTYSDYSDVSTHVFHNTNAATDIGRLFTAFGSGLATSVDQAGFQIALWEISYESTGAAYDVYAGDVTFLNSSGAALSRASYFLSNLAARSNVNVWVLESGTHQDMVHVTPVPEPSTYALMLAGLGVVGVVSRRRTTKGA